MTGEALRAKFVVVIFLAHDLKPMNLTAHVHSFDTTRKVGVDKKIFPECFRRPLMKLKRSTCGPRACS